MFHGFGGSTEVEGEARKRVEFGGSGEEGEGRGGLKRGELDGEEGRGVLWWERKNEEVEVGFLGL